MESPAQTCDRLLTALEDLVSEEAALLADEQVGAMVELQCRMAPLVDRLVALAASADSTLQSRVRALVARRAYVGAELATRLAHLHAELDRMSAARHTVNRIAPVYGAVPEAAPRQFSAVG
jgi:hypothetical protein